MAAPRAARAARATRPRTTISPMAARQPTRPAMSIPTGTPATVPRDRPRVIVAIARSRRPGIMAPAAPVASAVRAPAPTPATARATRKTRGDGLSAVIALPAVNTVSAVDRARRVVPVRVRRPGSQGAVSA